MADNNANPTATMVGGVHWAYYAPSGTTVPTDVADEPGDGLDGAFVGLGYTDNDGSSLTVDKQTTDLFASQAFDPLRRIVSQVTTSVTCPFIQWDANTLPVVFGGGEITSTPNGHCYTPPDAATIEEGILVLDVLDGDEIWRWVFERVIAAGSVTANLNKTSWGTLPVTFGALTPESGGAAWKLYGTNDSLDGGS